MAYKIVEDIHGTWHYHLTDQPKEGSSAKALCGVQTMWSGSLLDSWGYRPSHMPSSYCKECERIAGITREERR